MEWRGPTVRWTPFEGPPISPRAVLKKVQPRRAPDLAQVRASRKDTSPSAIGQGVLELCAQADVVYLALHGACGEDGRIQATLDLLGVPYTGSAAWARPSLWIRI